MTRKSALYAVGIIALVVGVGIGIVAPHLASPANASGNPKTAQDQGSTSGVSKAYLGSTEVSSGCVQNQTTGWLYAAPYHNHYYVSFNVTLSHGEYASVKSSVSSNSHSPTKYVIHLNTATDNQLKKKPAKQCTHGSTVVGVGKVPLNATTVSLAVNNRTVAINHVRSGRPTLQSVQGAIQAESTSGPGTGQLNGQQTANSSGGQSSSTSRSHGSSTWVRNATRLNRSRVVSDTFQHLRQTGSYTLTYHTNGKLVAGQEIGIPRNTTKKQRLLVKVQYPTRTAFYQDHQSRPSNITQYETITKYTAGNRTYNRYWNLAGNQTTAYSTTNTSAFRSLSGSGPKAVINVLSVGTFTANGTTSVNGTTLYRFSTHTIRNSRILGKPNLNTTNTTVSVYVDSRGVIHRYHLSTDVVGGKKRIHFGYALHISNVGSTTISKPAWTANASTAASQ